MRTIRNIVAVMLTGLAFAAFQVDACAQSREGASRSTKTTRSASSSSNVNRSTSSSNTARKQTAVKPSAQVSRPSSQTKPSAQASRPSSQTKPSAQASRPSSQAKPSTSAPNNRPQSGAVHESRPSSSVTRPDRPANRQPAGQTRPNEKPNQRPGAGSAYKPNGSKPPVKVYPDRKPEKPRVHPVHRDFISYDRPARFWTSLKHYFGHRVRVLPARARMYIHYGITYYCYDDIWYRPYGGYYVICRPPFGTVLAAELISDIAWAAVGFSYYNTVANTSRQINENNQYIAEQNAVIAQNNAVIAQQNKTMAMNQKLAAETVALADELGLIQSYASAETEYFYQDGVFYMKDSNGGYLVIVPPAGDLVESLPEDYEMVAIAGNEYYKVDDTVYKVVLNDGKLYFEVLGQMVE